MEKQDYPDLDLIRRVIRLDKETGKLYWLERTPDLFPDTGSGGASGSAARWNACWAGKEAAGHNVGYRRVKLWGRNLYAHTIVFGLIHGRWPAAIDHDNRNRSDNRPANLVERTQAENMKNQPLKRNNTSGVSGVSWNTRERKWVARINDGKSRLLLGKFDSFDEAVAARREAERRYGYHPNHGT